MFVICMTCVRAFLVASWEETTGDTRTTAAGGARGEEALDACRRKALATSSAAILGACMKRRAVVLDREAMEEERRFDALCNFDHFRARARRQEQRA